MGRAGSQAIQRRVARGADLRVLYDLWLENGGEKFASIILLQFWRKRSVRTGKLAVLPRTSAAQLDEALGLVPQSGQHQSHLYRGLKVLGLFPKVPERYRSRLMILANETSWQTREKARELLKGAEGIEDSIALQLEDGNQTVRANAAQWLVARGAKSHIPGDPQAAESRKERQGARGDDYRARTAGRRYQRFL